MKVSVEKIDKEKEEEVVIRCHVPESEWVDCVREAANGQMTVCGYKDAKLYRIYLSEICYFEVVDGNSFIRIQRYMRRTKSYMNLRIKRLA